MKRRYRHRPHNHEVPQPRHVGWGASAFDIPDTEGAGYSGLWRVRFEGECKLCGELVGVVLLLDFPVRHPGYGPGERNVA